MIRGHELRLHPKDPARTVTPVAIQSICAASFGLAAALTSWTAVALRSRPVVVPER